MRAIPAAQSYAHRKLALADGVASDQQHGDISAGDDQHQSDHGHEDFDRLIVLIAQAWNALGGGEREDGLGILGIGRTETNACCALERWVQHRQSLRGRDVGRETSDQFQAPPLWRAVNGIFRWRSAPGVQLGTVL
jgi:hypothetical protein